MEKYTLFVGNLTWRVRNRQLRELFALAPGVLSAEVIFHTTTPRRSAGYAFVSFSSKEAAEAAISSLNGQVNINGLYHDVCNSLLVIKVLLHSRQQLLI
jgi:RNA recognition motif-containing protein